MLHAERLCPKTVFVVGKVLYKASSFEGEDGKARTEIEEIHVRTVQMRAAGIGGPQKLTAFAYPKIAGVTWGKLSSKTADYGWLPGTNTSCQVRLIEGEPMPLGVGTTRLSAWQACLKVAQASLKRGKDFGHGEEYEAYVRSKIALIERRIAALRSAKRVKCP